MYELHIKSLNQALKLGLKLKKGTLDYQVWTKLLDEPLYYNEYQAKNDYKEWVWERLF